MTSDEVDRYQRLLEDWSWGSNAKGGRQNAREWSPAAETPRSPQPVPSASGVSSAPFQTGAILCLNGRNIAIYKQPVPEKEYHLMLALMPNHQIKTQGIAVEGHQVDEIGCVPPEVLERLQKEMRWNRDLLVFHCYSFKDAERIPQQVTAPPAAAVADSIIETETPPPAPPQPAAAPASAPARSPEPRANGAMRRGQRLQVRFGDKTWYAVYWGKDDQGQVVAHQTNRDWSLIHLDLDRFGTDLVIDPNVDSHVVEEIATQLSAR